MIFDLEEMSATSPLPVDDPILDFADVSGIESLPEISMSDVSGTGEVTLHAAEKCATIMVNFTRRLTPSDFTGFWYSCKSLNFIPAIFSSFPTSLIRILLTNFQGLVSGLRLCRIF